MAALFLCLCANSVPNVGDVLAGQRTEFHSDHDRNHLTALGARASHGIAWISLTHERVEGTTRSRQKGPCPPSGCPSMLGTVGHKCAKYFSGFDLRLSLSRPSGLISMFD